MSRSDTGTGDAFSALHPSVLFAYFALVIGCTMFVMNPLVLTLSFVGGALYCAHLTRGASRAGMGWTVLCALALPVLVNPLFNHAGATVLLRLWNGAPITLEALAFGAVTGVMLAAVMFWSGCYRIVMTADKTMALTGRVLPALSLTFSMALQFVPRFLAQYRRVLAAQRCIGRDIGAGTLRSRMGVAFTTMSTMATWAFEGSVQTADSMRSRGYGLPGRTSYARYCFDTRDRVACTALLVLGGVVVYGVVSGGLQMAFFPTFAAPAASCPAMAACGAFAALCVAPAIIDGVDEVQWRSLRSQI